MSQLALDDVQRDALASHLDSVGVAQLVRSEPPSYAGLRIIASLPDCQSEIWVFFALRQSTVFRSHSHRDGPSPRRLHGA